MASLAHAGPLCPQLPPAQNPARQEAVAPAVTPISELDMDAFAAKLVPEITKRRFSKVAVFGALGPADGLTVLGPMIGDALSAGLTRQAKGFQVIERSAIREQLQQEHVSEAMLLVKALACPTSELMGAQAVLFVQYENSALLPITITASLFDVHKEWNPVFKLDLSFVPDASQVKAASQPLYSDRTILAEYDRIGETNKAAHTNPQFTEAKCVSCGHPDYTDEAKKDRIQGEIWFSITVTAEGKAADITVVRALGHGLDQRAVEVIAGWKFKPALDKDGKAVDERVPVEIGLYLY